MKYVQNGKDIILTDIKDFNLEQTLECGQCFHFVRLDEGCPSTSSGSPSANSECPEQAPRSGVVEGHIAAASEYALSAFGRGLVVKQEGDTFTFKDTSEEEFIKVWIPYFDLERDYGEIKKFIVDRNPELEEIVKANAGIRLLNQDFFETLMSFIISQNNRIPQIKKVVADISEGWGRFLLEAGGKSLYSFPEPQALSGLCDADYREKKAGFRAAYLCDAVSRFLLGELDETVLRGISLEECEKRLCAVKGVGAKVANCIMLFSLGRREAFPIDVWMKRIMEQIYFKGKEQSKDRLATFAREKYGEYGGYAQQYLFAYARG